MRILVVILFFSGAVHGQVITTVAGNGSLGFSGDGGQALDATFNFPFGVCKDGSGNLYVNDINNARIRKVNLSTGIVTTVAGNGFGFTFPSGDGGSALNASVYPYRGIFTDKSGNVYFVDNAHGTVRKIDKSTGIIDRVAGTAQPLGPTGDGGTATSTWLPALSDAIMDDSGNLYIAMGGYNGKIRKVNATTGIITTIAGTGIYADAGDNGPATAASFKYLYYLAIDHNNNIYVADLSFKIRKIDGLTGIITTIAGTGIEGNTGDGGLAINAQIASPDAIKVDAVGNIYFVNNYYNTIRKIDVSTGIITTIAGNGFQGFSPDGTSATSAMLNAVTGMYIDDAGDLYFTEQYSRRVRKIAAVAPTVCTPQITISTTSSISCAGQPVAFSASCINTGTAPSFVWYRNSVVAGTGLSYNSNSLNDKDVISCKLISNATCAIQKTVMSNSIAITVNPIINPSVSIATTIHIICSGSTASFTATASNVTSQASYQWKVNNVNTGMDNPVFSINSLRNGDVVSCVLSSNNTCASVSTASSNNITINVDPQLPVSVTISANSMTICEGAVIGFTAFPVNGGSSPQYVWSVSGNDIANTNTNIFSTSNIKDKDVVSCRITSSAACVINSSVVANLIAVSVISKPTILIQASETTFCKGSLVDFKATDTNTGLTPAYQWQINSIIIGNNSNSFSTAELNNGDNVKCILTAGTACTSPIYSNEISVTVNDLPTVKIDSILVVVKGHSVQFIPIVSSNVNNYQWMPPTNLDRSNVANPVASPFSTMVYEIMVSTTADCKASASVKVVVLEDVNVPNVFSPNGDGINDTWQIPGLSSYIGCTIQLYNRGGQLIYQSTGYSKPWDGLSNGKSVPIGTYYYIINPKNGFAPISGSVTVIR